MKSKATGYLLLGLALVLTFTISARPARNSDGGDQQECRDAEHNAKAPLEAVGVVPIPGNVVASTDIVFVDPGTERVYLSDRSNKGVDIIDAEENTFVGRVTGFAGSPGVNGSGPGGVLVNAWWWNAAATS